MAEALLKSTKVRLVFNYGKDEKGKDILKNKLFSNIRMDATADEIQTFAKAIASLSTKPLMTVERDDSKDILS
jgi:ribosomal protein S7